MEDYDYIYIGSQLVQMSVSTSRNGGTATEEVLNFAYDASGMPATVSYDGVTYYYITNLQGDVLAIVDGHGATLVEYEYDPYGRLRSMTGVMSTTLGEANPLRYRGYVYDTESRLYYLQSRYYDPKIGRFINADALVSTGQGVLGYNMFAYCNNNPVSYTDILGCSRVPCTVCIDDGGAYPPNIEFLMAFYGADTPGEVPDLPEGAMIYAENITSISFSNGVCFIQGKTVVFDEYRYCEYDFSGFGWGVSKSMPLDMAITQGYVYGLENVSDYEGVFFGGTFNMLSNAAGGALALNKVYAEVVYGMSYAPSIGASVTYYSTSQSDWTYGKANMVILTNPYPASPIKPDVYS